MQPQHTITNVIGSLKLQLRQHKLLLLTLLGSILLHIALFNEFSISLPKIIDDNQMLEMQLVKLQPKQNDIPAPVKKKKITPEKSPPKPALSSKPTQKNITESFSDSVNFTENTAPAASAEEIKAEPQPPGEEDSISETPAYIFKEEASKEPVYTHVETEFEVMRGIDTPAAGITKIVFNIDENGHYSIISSTQAKGFASLFFGDLIQKSEGSVTESGLKPDFYYYQYGSDKKKLQTANFNWSEGVLHMHTYKGDSTASLVAGTQDFLSFMYQFLFLPPLDSMQITMTNGKRLRTYTYSFEGEEFITTRLGELNTIHLLKGGSDEDKTEIWLATDYQYLPVKIRKTEKDGMVIEQIISSISTDIPD